MGNDKLVISIPSFDAGPYGAAVCDFLARDFPNTSRPARVVLDELTTAVVASGQIRYGPTPNPESLVAIRAVLSKHQQAGTPVSLLVPWGSKKPDNGLSVDIAEVSALKVLSCLAARVRALHAPGIRIRLRLEDLGGYWLFSKEGPDARASSERYVADMLKLIRIVGIGDFVEPVLESQLTTEEAYMQMAASLMQPLVNYLNESDLRGLAECDRLSSWAVLRDLGWQGCIPLEQRDFYRGRYECLYPESTPSDRTEMLARYLAGSLARYRLSATGPRPEWGSDYIQLNFASPVPGAPASIVSRTVHYRTVPSNFSRTHIPPWRAKGYLRVEAGQIVPSLAGGTKPPEELQEFEVRYASGEDSVLVRTDYLIAD